VRNIKPGDLVVMPFAFFDGTCAPAGSAASATSRKAKASFDPQPRRFVATAVGQWTSGQRGDLPISVKSSGPTAMAAITGRWSQVVAV
jgi:hypothetical protein